MSKIFKNILGSLGLVSDSECSSEKDNLKADADTFALNYGDEAIARSELVDKINPPKPLLASEKYINESTKDDLYKKKYLKYKQKYLNLKKIIN